MSNAHLITLDKDKILNQIGDLAGVAKKDQWEFNYDPDTDEMVFGRKTMPRDSFLFNVNDELNLFLSPDSTVNGIFIEYFANNFIEHNQELRPILEILERANPKDDTKKTAQTKKALETELMAGAFTSLFGKDQLVTAI